MNKVVELEAIFLFDLSSLPLYTVLSVLLLLHRTLFFNSSLNEEISLHLLELVTSAHITAYYTLLDLCSQWASLPSAPESWSCFHSCSGSPIRLPNYCFPVRENIPPVMPGKGQVYWSEVLESTKELIELFINTEFKLHRSMTESSRVSHGHLFLKSFTSNSIVNLRWHLNPMPSIFTYY